MKYNEIYPAEGWAKKISKFLTRVVEQKPRMYAKTKRRYINLGCVLLDCVNKIFSILEEDSLVPEDTTDEFNDLASSTDTRILHEKLAEMTRKLQTVDDFAKPRRNSSLQAQSCEEPSSESDSDDSPKYSYYETIEYYDSVFKEASAHNFGYSEVNECAKLLYKWFHTRFAPDVPDSNFHCQIRYLPIWISSFIITYGRYYQASKLESFRSSLDKWCKKVDSGKGGNYAMPYDIYRLEHDFKEGKCQPEEYTLEAVVIADILVSEYLFLLGEDNFEGMVHYKFDDVANIVRDRNPSLMPQIKSRIAKRKLLVREIGLTPVGGSSIDE